MFVMLMVMQTYYGSVYVLSQYAQGTSPQDTADNTLIALGVGLMTARAYGWMRDKFFEKCGEPGTLTRNEPKDISKTAQFLNLPLSDVYRVLKKHTTVHDAYMSSTERSTSLSST